MFMEWWVTTLPMSCYIVREIITRSVSQSNAGYLMTSQSLVALCCYVSTEFQCYSSSNLWQLHFGAWKVVQNGCEKCNFGIRCRILPPTFHSCVSVSASPLPPFQQLGRTTTKTIVLPLQFNVLSLSTPHWEHQLSNHYRWLPPSFPHFTDTLKPVPDKYHGYTVVVDYFLSPPSSYGTDSCNPS